MFTIDGLVWPYPCGIEREAEIKPSEISGMLLDRSWFNDVLGTYMSYTVRIAVPLTELDEYDRIYETLTDPVDAHVFALPYAQGMLTVTARVERIGDALVELGRDGQYWKGLSFTCIGMHPSKQMTLGEVLARGRTPLPESSKVSLGDLYEYKAAGWTQVFFDDADLKEY